MITRMWECKVVPAVLDEFVVFIRDTVWADMAEADGFVDGELYRSLDAEARLVFISHWRDEAALEAFAGPDWRTAPLVDDLQRDYLAGPSHVWHFVPVTGWASG